MLATSTIKCLLLLFLATDASLVDTMVQRLGSDSYRERQAATRWLMERPTAAGAVRVALTSSDSEVATRAVMILDHFDRRPIRDLSAAVQAGAVERVVGQLVEWPRGKFEREASDAIRRLCQALAERHQTQGGQKLELSFLEHVNPPVVITGQRITQGAESVKPDLHEIPHLFLRGRDVLLDERGMPAAKIIVASGRVQIRSVSLAGCSNVILAKGPVELMDIAHAVVISCDDITLKGNIIHCLVIARGKIVCKGGAGNSRLISGTSVTINKRNMENCVITENEANPLGFVRFGEHGK